jgi:hypothetical protein
MKTFTRDSTIHLKFNFRDHAGNLLNPGSATVSFSYRMPDATDWTTVSYALVNASGYDWTYDWDSSVASPGVVPVHAETDGGPPTSAIDTCFRLKANQTNRKLAGDYWLDWDGDGYGL